MEPGPTPDGHTLGAGVIPGDRSITGRCRRGPAADSARGVRSRRWERNERAVRSGRAGPLPPEPAAAERVAAGPAARGLGVAEPGSGRLAAAGSASRYVRMAAVRAATGAAADPQRLPHHAAVRLAAGARVPDRMAAGPAESAALRWRQEEPYPVDPYRRRRRGRSPGRRGIYFFAIRDTSSTAQGQATPQAAASSL